MSYKSWHESHSKKHKIIIDKLSHLNTDEIIEYFNYDNMQQNEVDFCPLYIKNTKCHDIENLNCYLCACPNFRVNLEKSHCDINSKDGGSITSKNGYIHQDCSNCNVPHKVEYIKNNFDTNWSNIMKNTF